MNGSERSSRCSKRPIDTDTEDLSTRRRQRSRRSTNNVESEEPDPVWHEDRSKMKKKIEDQEADNSSLRRDNAAGLKEVDRKSERISEFQSHLARSKQVENEVKAKLGKSQKDHSEETEVRNLLREELNISTREADRMKDKHTESSDKITTLGINAAKHQSERDKMATRIVDAEASLKQAADNINYAEERAKSMKCELDTQRQAQIDVQRMLDQGISESVQEKKIRLECEEDHKLRHASLTIQLRENGEEAEKS